MDVDDSIHVQLMEAVVVVAYSSVVEVVNLEAVDIVDDEDIDDVAVVP